MTENEAINLHIGENLHRISTIEDFLRTNPHADDKKCRKNINILTKINGVLQEIQKYRAIGTVEECRKAKEMSNSIDQCILHLRRNGYIVRKWTKNMQQDSDECVALDEEGKSKDCGGCSCSVCLLQ